MAVRMELQKAFSVANSERRQLRYFAKHFDNAQRIGCNILQPKEPKHESDSKLINERKSYSNVMLIPPNIIYIFPMSKCENCVLSSLRSVHEFVAWIWSVPYLDSRVESEGRRQRGMLLISIFESDKSLSRRRSQH